MIRDLIKKHEGLRLRAYPDPGSDGAPWTIGYGHTRGVKPGDTCTLEQAEEWLTEDLNYAYKVVDKNVKVSLTSNQRDALASFVFNVGEGRKGVKDGFVSLKSGNPSTLLKKLNSGTYKAAADELLKWVYGSGRKLPGLVKRRKEERELFLSDIAVKGEDMSLAGSVLISALPNLIGALPELGKIFTKPDVAERNVEAAAKVGEILVQASGATNMQDAVERVQADPTTAQEVNEALRLNRADLGDLIERMEKMDSERVEKAREYNDNEKPIAGKWKFVHILSIMFVVLGGAGAWYVLGSSEDATERAMALQTLLLTGFGGVAAFWLGSSRGSQLKDEMRK